VRAHTRRQSAQHRRRSTPTRPSGQPATSAPSTPASTVQVSTRVSNSAPPHVTSEPAPVRTHEPTADAPTTQRNPVISVTQSSKLPAARAQQRGIESGSGGSR
jgi:hypothetical protein